MKKIILSLLAFGISGALYATEPTAEKVIFEDNFDGTSCIPDTAKWELCKRWHPDWARDLSESYDQAYVKDGKLVLVAEKKDGKYLTGGIQTKGKFDFTYGKVECCARFVTQPKGNWSAIWMMPAPPTQEWPRGGEIDIMEHLSADDLVYQTIHSYYKNELGHENDPQGGDTVRVNNMDWNVYGVIWTPEELIFTINDEQYMHYPNLNLPNNQEVEQWPFDKPFYLIVNQSLGGDGTWPGPIDDSELPAIFEIDWIKVTQSEPKVSCCGGE